MGLPSSLLSNLFVLTLAGSALWLVLACATAIFDRFNSQKGERNG